MRTWYNRMRMPLKFTAVIAFLIAILILPGCVGTTIQAQGWSGGILDDDTLYFGSRSGDIVAVNVNDKTKEWAAPLETGSRTTGFLGCSSSPIVVAIYGSPAVADNLIYIGGYNGRVYAFADGKDNPREYPSDKEFIKGSIAGGVAVAEGKVFFGSSDGTIYAIPAAGNFEAWAEEWRTLWTFRTGDKVWSTPTVSNGTVYIGSFDHNLYALDAATGTEKWQFPTKGVIITTPVIDNDTIFIGSFDRRIYAIDADSGQLKWSFKAQHGFWATPVVYNGVVYAPSLDGKMHILDTNNGRELSEINLKAPVSSSPVIVGNSVVVATQESKGSNTEKKGAAIWTIDVTSHNGKEIARLNGDKVHASLTAGEGSVFVHTDKDMLYSVDTTTGAILQFSVK